MATRKGSTAPIIDSTLIERKMSYNVMDYGAVGDGVADDTSACQAALDAAPAGSEVVFPLTHYVPGNLSFSKKYMTIKGPGTILGGKLVIGDTSTNGPGDIFYTVTGLTFRYAALTTGGHGIEFLKARRGTITNCVFENCDKAVHVYPISNPGTHQTAQIKVIKNEFVNVNYAFYVDTNGTNWQTVSDCKFIQNTVNVAWINHIWVRALDGLVCTDNVFFFPSYNANPTARGNKKNNIYMGQSDWVVITGNNFFEAGEEAILLDQAKHFTIADNLIAWPGQKGPFHAISLTGANTYAGSITGNVISRFSGNAVNIDSPGVGIITVKNNVFEYDAASPQYFGTPALNTFEHYGVNVASSNVPAVYESGNQSNGNGYSLQNNIKGVPKTGLDLSPQSVFYTRSLSRVVTASTPFTLAQACSGGGGTGAMAGLMLIQAKGGTTSTSNQASYVLHVSRTSTTAEMTLISEQGLSKGASGAASWPSFAFSIASDGTITASPRQATAGTFYFDIVTIGNLNTI